jgi:hypothetical protein
MPETEPGVQPERQLLLVAGQGRSGTSLYTGIMRELGLHVPQPEIAADQTNPKGFSEPQWVVDFHKRLLQRQGVRPSDARPSGWDATGQTAGRDRVRAELRTWLGDQLADNPRLIVKDPRTAWFLELWRVAARDLELPVAVATMLRHPAEVVLSRRNAYGGRGDLTSQIAGWINGMLFTERATRDLPRTFVRYESLLADWAEETGRADRQLGLRLVPSATDAQIQAASKIVDPELHRSRTSIDDLELPDPLRQLALNVWEQLGALADDPVVNDGDARAASLDELRDDYVRYYKQCEAVARSSILAAAESGPRRPRHGAAKPGDKPASAGRAAAEAPRRRRMRRRSQR